MDTFPIMGDELAIKHKEGDIVEWCEDGQHVYAAKDAYYSGWLLLLDEFNSASMAVQAAAYKLVLDRYVGMHKLHSKVAVMCAGNLSSDKAIVNRTSTAMQSRLVHLGIKVNHREWLDWASTNEVDYRIIGFINFRTELLHNFTPDHNDKTFPCPRTWKFMSDIIKPMETILPDKLALLAGTIGVGAANEFYTFCEIYGEIPDIAEIINNPKDTVIKRDPSIHYALSALIARHMDANNPNALDSLVTFVSRLPIEFQVITFQDAVKRQREIVNTPRISEWFTANHQNMI